MSSNTSGLIRGLSRYFWGSFLISLGIGLFIFKIIPFPMHTMSISMFLAVVLILLGISFFTSSIATKRVIVGFVGLLLAFLTLNVYYHAKHKLDTYSDNYYNSNNPTRDTIISFGNVKVDSSTVSINLCDTDLEITDINTTHLKLNYNGFNAFKLDYDSLSNTYNLTSQLYDNEDEDDEVAKVQLNDTTLWFLKGKLNSSDFWANFRNIKLARLYLNATKSDLDIEFGEKSPNIDVQILSHYSEIDLIIPYNAYCEISSNVPLGHYIVDELKEESPGFYTCGNPEQATTKMKITLTGNLKEFKLSRVK